MEISEARKIVAEARNEALRNEADSAITDMQEALATLVLRIRTMKHGRAGVCEGLTCRCDEAASIRRALAGDGET